MKFKELIRLHTKFILSGIRDARTFLNVALVILAAFLIVNFVHATTPNPGHPWTDIGDGVFIFTNGQTTTPYTYTFPAANSTVLTTNNLVTVGQGGTGLNTFGGTNTVLFTSAANTLTSVPASTAAGQFLQTTASGGTPAWATTLGIANGGTGAALSAVNGGVVYSNASTFAISAAGSSGQILQSAGAATPVWSTATYPATAGTSGNVLRSNGTNWASANITSSGFVKGSTTACSDVTASVKQIGFGSVATAATYTTLAASNSKGNLLVTLNFQINSPATSALTTKYQLVYGTGTDNGCNGTATGTAVGQQYTLSTIAAVAGTWPVSVTAVITGVSAATTYWFDIQATDSSTATWGYTNPQLSVLEF
jgi:hypothetical protein